jgi:hypothetical protein
MAAYDYEILDAPAGVPYALALRPSLGYEFWGLPAEVVAFAPAQLPPAVELPFLLKTPRTPGGPNRLRSELGIDVACLLDTDPAWSLASGELNLGYALARRLSTPRGGLFYDPNYGFDVRLLLHAALGDSELSTAAVAIGDECEKDERVQACNVGLSFNQASETLIIDVTVTTAAGPFRLILEVSAVTVAVLEIAA